MSSEINSISRSSSDPHPSRPTPFPKATELGAKVADTVQEMANHIEGKAKTNEYWTKLKTWYNNNSASLIEVVTNVAVAILIGIGLHFISINLALPLYYFAGASILANIAVKIGDSYNFAWLNDKIKEPALQFNEKYPSIYWMSMIIAVAASAFFPPVGVLIAIPVGAYFGVIIQGKKVLEEQRQKQEASAPAASA